MHLNARIERHTTISDDNLNIGIWSHAKHTCLGYVGEIVAKKLFEYNNLDVWHTGNFQEYDLTVNGIRFEVKTARLNKDNRYSFCLNRVYHCDIRHADYVVLLAVGKHGNISTYIIPTDVLHNVKTLKLTPGSKRGKYHKYQITNYSSIMDYIQ